MAERYSIEYHKSFSAKAAMFIQGFNQKNGLVRGSADSINSFFPSPPFPCFNSTVDDAIKLIKRAR